MTIDSYFIDKLKNQISVSDLVSKKVKLTKRGKDYFGCCPFHSEKTPSFSVNNDEKFYHCFGCGANGDNINFVQETQSLDFNAAVKYLANKYGIPLPVTKGNEYEKESTIIKINKLAADWFHKYLYTNQALDCLNNLHKRGIANDHIREFFIGYAPDNRVELINHLKKSSVSAHEIESSGLRTKFDSGEIIDKFRNRVIFPIFNHKNTIVGFGGRALGDVKPKYLNSLETEVFKKK